MISYLRFRRQVSDESDLLSGPLDDDRLVVKAGKGRLLADVNVGADDGEGNVAKERDVAVDAVVKLVISGRLKKYLRNVYPCRSVKLTQWALHSKNLLR